MEAGIQTGDYRTFRIDNLHSRVDAQAGTRAINIATDFGTIIRRARNGLEPLGVKLIVRSVINARRASVIPFLNLVHQNTLIKTKRLFKLIESVAFLNSTICNSIIETRVPIAIFFGNKYFPL